MQRNVPVAQYILRHENGNYVGVDQASGGYPWFTEYWDAARIWRSEEDARKYMEVFARSSDHISSKYWTLCRIKFETIPVSKTGD